MQDQTCTTKQVINKIFNYLIMKKNTFTGNAEIAKIVKNSKQSTQSTQSAKNAELKRILAEKISYYDAVLLTWSYVNDTFDFNLSKSFGPPNNKPGNTPGNWKPSSICSSGDELFVLDRHTHKVQVFNISTGRFLKSWGKVGSRDGEFNDPCCARAREREIFISDSGNNRIYVFSAADSKLLRTIICCRPTYMSFSEDQKVLFVADCKGGISVVDTSVVDTNTVAVDTKLSQSNLSRSNLSRSNCSNCVVMKYHLPPGMKTMFSVKSIASYNNVCYVAMTGETYNTVMRFEANLKTKSFGRRIYKSSLPFQEVHMAVLVHGTQVIIGENAPNSLVFLDQATGTKFTPSIPFIPTLAPGVSPLVPGVSPLAPGVSLGDGLGDVGDLALHTLNAKAKSNELLVCDASNKKILAFT